MPLSSAFAAGDTDYIAKLNELGNGLLAVTTIGASGGVTASYWYVVTTSGITVTLPAAPPVGTRIKFTSGSSSVVSLTIARNGNLMDSVAADVILSGEATINVDLLFVGGAIGWRVARGGGGGMPVSIQTTGFTALVNNHYVIKTGSYTATLPAGPNAGDMVRFTGADYNVSALTLGRNSSKIDSLSSDYVVGNYNFDVWAVYVDGTIGWKLIFITRGNAVKSPTISSGTLTLDLDRGRTNTFTVSLNANITTLTISNPPASGDPWGFEIIFTADGTQRTVTWAAAVKWAAGLAPVLTLTNAKVDRYYFETFDGGTVWFASVIGQNY